MLSFPEIFGLWRLPLPAEITLLVLLGVVMTCQGAKHGWFYSFRKDGQKPSTPGWFPELHWVDRRMMWAIYALLAVAGCDLVRVLLAQSVARPAFQYFIDMGATGRPFSEQETYREQLPSGEWRTHRKNAVGTERLWVAGGALVLLFTYAPLLRLLLDVLGLGGFLSFFS